MRCHGTGGVIMGMFDTFLFKCANCGELTDSQTKLGERCLDTWALQDETTVPDGSYRVKDPCQICEHRNTVVIKNGILTSVLKDAPADAKQEGLWGAQLDLSVDYDAYEKELTDGLAAAIKGRNEQT